MKITRLTAELGIIVERVRTATAKGFWGIGAVGVGLPDNREPYSDYGGGDPTSDDHGEIIDVEAGWLIERDCEAGENAILGAEARS